MVGQKVSCRYCRAICLCKTFTGQKKSVRGSDSPTAMFFRHDLKSCHDVPPRYGECATGERLSGFQCTRSMDNRTQLQSANFRPNGIEVKARLGGTQLVEQNTERAPHVAGLHDRCLAIANRPCETPALPLPDFTHGEAKPRIFGPPYLLQSMCPMDDVSSCYIADLSACPLPGH
jgi:hypothetical protein